MEQSRTNLREGKGGTGGCPLHAGRGPEQTGGPSVLKEQSCGAAENREFSAGKGLVVMAAQEFGSQDVFLSNPRRELSVTQCSHSSVTFSSL